MRDIRHVVTHRCNELLRYNNENKWKPCAIHFDKWFSFEDKPREWILKTEPQAPGTEVKILTVDDALKEVEKEKENTKVLLKVGLDGGELTAKGRKRRAANKSKNKKKKQRAKNGKLHETKSLVSNQKKAQQKWNGRTDQIKNISAISFLKNKDNYTKLKEKKPKIIIIKFKIISCKNL